MLTIKHADFKAKTKRSFPRYRSKRMDAVLAALLAYETTANPDNLKTLRDAVKKWKETDPKEFAGRDKLSKDLCSDLAKELGIYFFDAPALNLLAHEITGVSRASSNLRPTTTFVNTNTTTPDHMASLADRKIAVMLIDMQAAVHEASAEVAKTPEDLRSGGFSTNYNHQSVLENCIEVLDAARELDIPLFDVTTGASKDTISALRSHFPKPSSVHAYKKVSNNAMDPSGVSGKPLIERINAVIATGGTRYIVVMGFDANQCVKGTIFGSLGVPSIRMEYKRGLLDLGFTVITSRKILASSNRPLESEYGPLQNM